MVYRPVGENIIYVSGQLPIDNSGYYTSVAVHNPAGLFVSLLKDALAQRGIVVSGRARVIDWKYREVTRLDLTKAASTNGKTFLGDSRVSMSVNACRAWGVAAKASRPAEPVRSKVPVLLVSGELDPNTPPRHAAEALRTLPNGRHIVLAGVAHGWSGVETCGAAFVADFIARASTNGLDVGCARVSSAPQFVISPSSR